MQTNRHILPPFWLKLLPLKREILCSPEIKTSYLILLVSWFPFITAKSPCLVGIPPQKLRISPETTPSQKESHFPTIDFQGLYLCQDGCQSMKPNRNTRIWFPCSFAECCSFRVKYMSRSPLALGVAGGSLSSILFRFASELVQEHWDSPLLEPAISCACNELSGYFWGLDSRSLIIGICIGFTLGPLLELLFLIRHWWASVVRRQLLILGRISGPIYRDI